MDEQFSLIARDLERNLVVAEDMDEDTTTLDIQLQKGRVFAGRVETVEQKPIAGASITLFLWSGSVGSQLDGQRVKTDEAGRFEISALPPDRRYSLNATAKGYGSDSQEVEEIDTDTNRLELEPFVLNRADCFLAGIVVDVDEKPVARAHVYMYGEGQPNTSQTTDAEGRFRFDAVCEGLIQLSASAERSHGSASAEAGETNVVITLGVQEGMVLERPARRSLKGLPLPDVVPFGLTGDRIPTGQPLLLCLFDVEQRPSRRAVRLLAGRQEELSGKAVAFAVLQAAVIEPDTLQLWEDDNAVQFPVGRVAEKTPANRWVIDVESLPWLILTDADGKVVDEGFGLDELDAKIAGLEE
jgi:hypothetical protein